jgi:predicted GIY-YIG superfamily endonuclease
MTIIYKLFSKSHNSFYIGSTTKTLRERLVKHRSKSNEAPNRKVYKCILESGGFSDWQMEALEVFDANSSVERRRREQFYIDTLKPDLNSCLAIV